LVVLCLYENRLFRNMVPDSMLILDNFLLEVLCVVSKFEMNELVRSFLMCLITFELRCTFGFNSKQEFILLLLFLIVFFLLYGSSTRLRRLS
jgi:hypothetical protein